MRTIDLAIIGSGPAGYTAAIYAARANVPVIVFQGAQPGGQLTITTEVENFPGFAHGIQGPALMEQFQQQAERVGAKMEYATITKVDFSQRPFILTIDAQEQIAAKAVIISTGASAKWLGIESEQRLNGSGVSACAVCDGFFFKNQEVAIVGAGDTACEEALYLAKLCKKVNMIIRKDTMRASKIMQQRVIETPNIEVHWNSSIHEIVGTKSVESVSINKNGTTINIPLKAVFIAIGHQPNSEIFKGQIDLDEQGYIKTIAGSSKTNIEGVFAAGDIQDKIYRQAVTAAGSGCMAALDAERFLASHA